MQCEKQKAEVAIIHITDISGYTQKDALQVARDTLNKKLSYVKEIVLIYGDKVHYLK